MSNRKSASPKEEEECVAPPADGVDSPLPPPPPLCSQAVPHIDVKMANPIGMISSNSFSERTHELNLSLDVNDEDSSLHSGSPLQAVTSYPNLPSLHINDSRTPEENILCALEPSPRQRQDTPIYRPYKSPHKPKLLREAAKSEPPFPSQSHSDFHTNIHKKIQHIKSSKSLHHSNISNLHHITSQPPPMPSYYLHRQQHKSRTPSNLSTISTLSNTSSVYAPSLHTKHQSMNLQKQLQHRNLHHSPPSSTHHHHPHHPLPLTHSNHHPPHKSRRHHVRFDTQPQQIVPPMVSKLLPKPRHEPSHSGFQSGKKKRSRKKNIKRSETPQPVYDTDDKEVRVMRDKEVLQMDEEIPIEKFISALKKGYARIMTEDDQNEEYTRSARIARSVSVGNMQAYKDEILAEQKERRQQRKEEYRNKKRKKKRKKKRRTKRHRMSKSKSTRSTPNCKKQHYSRSATVAESNGNFQFSKQISNTLSPKLVMQRAADCTSTSGTESDSSSIGGDLVGPPPPPSSNELLLAPRAHKRKANSKRLQRSQTHENRDRGRSHKMRKATQDSTTRRGRSRSRTDEENGTGANGRRTANGNYRNRSKTGGGPSQKCPRSPTIPEEDDILDIDHNILNIGDDDMSPSDMEFSSDSDLCSSSSSSTDHDCEMPIQSSKPKVVVAALPAMCTPALNHSAKSMNDVRSSLGLKFKIIKNERYHEESEEDINGEEDHEDSIERLMNSLESEPETYSIESGNHLTVNASSPLQLAIVDEMRQKSLSNEHNPNKEDEEDEEVDRFVKDMDPDSPPMVARSRALSNESASSSSSRSISSSSSSSSSSGSSDWDAEVRAEEEEAVRQERRANGILSEHESETEEEEDESEPSSELATSSDSEDEIDLNKRNSDQTTTDASTETENLTESESEPECEDKEKNTRHYSLESRPQSTPFRSSKGTAVFLSHLKSYRSNHDLRGGALHLNELINCNQSRGRPEHMAMSHPLVTGTRTSSLLQTKAEATQPNEPTTKEHPHHVHHTNGYNYKHNKSMKMKKKTLASKPMANRETYGVIQKRQNAFNAYAKVNV